MCLKLHQYFTISPEALLARLHIVSSQMRKSVHLEVKAIYSTEKARPIIDLKKIPGESCLLYRLGNCQITILHYANRIITCNKHKVISQYIHVWSNPY